jgi:hypothetical protein
MRLIFLIALMAVIFSRESHSFPQMMAHGYASCVACHVAPSGGGLLSAYGRSLSREALSQWGVEGEEKFLYGAVETPTWSSFGGDFRLLQIYSNNEQVEQARFFPMQADVELGVITEKWQFVGTVGYQSPRSVNYSGSKIFSRRHYAQFSSGTGTFVRAGKFEANYGIRWPDHFMFHRKDLLWDEGSEAYRLEWTEQGDEWEVSSAVSMGRPESSFLDIEKSASVRLAKFFLETNGAFLSAYYGNNARGSRLLLGPAVALNPVGKLMVFSQVDFQKVLGNRGDTFGFTQYVRLNYEWIKGVHLQAIQEFSKLDLQSSSAKQAYTLGVQWFPRPHVELSGAVRKSVFSGVLSSITDSAWLLIHYYL